MTAIYDLKKVPSFVHMKDSQCPELTNQYLQKVTRDGYVFIRYIKENLLTEYGLCRSVILNSNCQIVSFAPPKSIPAHTFMETYPNLETQPWVEAQEFVEGTMFNVFFDPLLDKWEITTRNTLGARSSFYKAPVEKTFRDMFMDAMQECNLNFQDLNPILCYSFVLQHPDNRIVVPFQKPGLYLVAVYEIDNENLVVYPKDVRAFEPVFMNTSVQFPIKYSGVSYEQLIQRFGSMNTPYELVGVVLYNRRTGERSKIRNPVYEQVRQLRGNQPKLQYQYLSLRQHGKVKEYLNFYPEHKSFFSTFRNQVHLFTKTLHQNYLDCYVRKHNPLSHYPKQYQPHMAQLHSIYLSKLLHDKQRVTNTVVQQYVNALEPARLMFALNYSLRKQQLDG